jgi:xanthine dehydrogenase YagT iron-sulfur-binding subunit
MTRNKDSDRNGPGLNRRGFLGSLGIGAVTATSSCKETLPAAEPQPPSGPEWLDSEAMAPVTLEVNGHKHRMLVEPRWSLLFALRDRLGLTGTKPGCERGECGACTVLIDDVPRYACMTLAVEAQDHRVTTVEGLMKGEQLGPVQQAFVEKDALQCGYCTSGQVMAVEGLLRHTPNPSLDAIRQGVSGNICRCGAYANIFAAARVAAATRRGG